MGVFLALLAAVFTAVFQVFMKFLGKSSKNMWINVSAYSLVAGVCTGIYTLTEPIKYNFSYKAIIPLILAWIAWLAVSELNYIAVKKLEVSVNIILAQIALVVSYIGAVVFFNDQVNLVRILGVIMVIGATVLIFAKKDAFNGVSKSGVIIRIIASSIFGIALLMDKFNTGNYSIGIYMTMAYVVPGVASWIISRASFKEYFTELKTTWKIVVSLGFVSASAYLVTLQAYKMIEASLVFTIMNFATVITVFIGVIFFKERNDLIRKFLALIIILIAAILINNS